MILREVYSLEGVQPESPTFGANKVTLYNPSVLQPNAMSSPQSYSNFGGSTYNNSSLGNTPVPYAASYYQGSQPPIASITQTAPAAEPVGPPPLAGFVRHSPLTNVRR